MKKITFLLAVMPSLLTAQGGWNKVSSPDNPVAAFSSAGIYKGAAWIDINRDGNIDLFAMPNWMFLNKGNGRFEQLNGLNINPSPRQRPGGCSWGDINNDGNIDLITAQNPSEVYLNNGDLTFQNITSRIPSLDGYASWGCAMADLDLDQQLDLLFAHANGFHGTASPKPCYFFMQDASPLSFKQKTGYLFTDSLKPYTVPYFHDYDLDGDMDVFIASGPGGSPGPDYCYRNMKKETGKDTLYRMTAEPWSSQLQDGQCYNFIDYDNDGDLDMYLTNYSGARDRFFKNNGGGHYESLHMPFTDTLPHLSNAWGDFDNDGDLDLAVASDNTPPAYFTNLGDGTFSPSSAFVAPPGSNCIISCDYDNDGDLDIFIHGNDNAKALYRNDSAATGRNWINYTLKGTVSNLSAIGAVIKVKATIRGRALWQLRTITAQNSFQGQNDLRQHFGLHDATHIDSILIHWPSGIREYYTQKDINRFETLVEGNGTPLLAGQLHKTDVLTVYPTPAKNEIIVSSSDANFISAQPLIRIFNMNGKEIRRETLSSGRLSILLGGVASGTYLLIVDHAGKVFTQKILVQP